VNQIVKQLIDQLAKSFIGQLINPLFN